MKYLKYYFFSLTVLIEVACGQNKPTKTEGKIIDSNQLTEQADRKEQNADTVYWLTPTKFTPLSFLNEVIQRADKDTVFNVITMVDDFPVEWVKESDIDTLVRLITSTKKCNCLVNPLSSYLPTNQNADIGGYAIIFINSFREKSKISLGLYSCPKTNKKSVEEINKWWTKYKLTK